MRVEQLLKEKHGELAHEVLACDVSSLEWVQTRQGEPNLHDLSSEPVLTPPFLHSRYSVAREVDGWLERLEWENLSKKINVLYVYGLGTGELFDRLLPWLEEKPDHYLVFFEDDLRVWRRFLETPRAEVFFTHRQVMLFHPGQNEEQVDLLAEELAYYFVQLPIFVTALPSYARHREKQFQYLQMRLMHQAVYVSYGSEEFLHYGGGFFRNYYTNLQWLPGSSRPGSLFGKFCNIPAIICGAGPSLNRNLDCLAGLERRALIFSGGSAMNALTNRGITPHFGATVDPNAEQVKRVTTQSGFAVPYFFKGRTHMQVMPRIQGPRIYLSGNAGYPVCSWIERKLGVEEPLVAEGHNVLHMTMDIARLMGCNPIIFVGMDLAYTGMQQYAGAVVAQPQMDEGALTAASDLNNNSFLRNDIYGQPVYTLWKWIAEANYTAKYVMTHSDQQFMNATEGGIGVQGVPNLPLREVCEKYLVNEWDLRGAVHSCLETSRYTIAPKQIKAVLGELQKSLKRSKAVCCEIGDLFETLKKHVASRNFSEVELINQKIEERQLKLGKEEALEQVLSPVNHIRSILFERRHDEVGIKKSAEEQQIVECCNANRDEMQSLVDAAEKNLKEIAIPMEKVIPE